MPEIELKLKWRRTEDDVDNDFSAFDERYKDGPVGRFYLHDTGPSKGQYFWSLVAYGKDLKRPGLDRGYADSAREAGACVEKAWFEAIGDTVANTYAKAKDPG